MRALALLLLVVGCSESSPSTAPPPQPEECFAATTCRKESCSGPITKSGCTARCGPGEVDQATCFRDVGVDADAVVDSPGDSADASDVD